MRCKVEEKEAIPVRSEKVGFRQVPWWTKELYEIRWNVRKLRKNFQRDGDEEEKRKNYKKRIRE